MDKKTDRKPTSLQRVGASRVKKEAIVAKIKDKAVKAKGLVFTNYQGLTHKQIEDLKNKIRDFDADLVVTKNTLLARAMADSRWQIADTNELAGPTATLFLYGDPIPPLKQLAKTIKEFNLPSVKFGILDGQIVTNEDILKLSALLPKDILIAQFVFGIKSPLSRLHRGLNWNIQKLVMTVKAVENLKNQNSNVKSASQS